MDALTNTRIYISRSELVKNLSGFEKHHDIPTSVNHHALDWLERVTHSELDARLDRVFQSLRTNFGFKRRQLNVFGPQDRCGVIETPYFNYQATVGLNEEAPNQVVWVEEVNHIVDADQLMGAEFKACFAETGWGLEVQFEDDLDLEDIVDRIEDEELDGFYVDYDKDLEWCEIRIPESPALLRATSNSFNVSIKGDSSPRELVVAVSQFQDHLLGQMRRLGG